MSLGLLIRALTSPSACCDRVCFSLLVMLLILLIVLSRAFLIHLWCWWSWWGTRPELSRNIRHSRSSFGKSQKNVAPLPDRSQTTSHDDSSSEGTACSSGRGSDPMKTRVRSTLLPCLWSFQNLLAQVLLILLNLEFLRIHYCTEIARSLSQSVYEKTSIYPDSCLSDLVELWCT